MNVICANSSIKLVNGFNQGSIPSIAGGSGTDDARMHVWHKRGVRLRIVHLHAPVELVQLSVRRVSGLLQKEVTSVDGTREDHFSGDVGQEMQLLAERDANITMSVIMVHK